MFYVHAAVRCMKMQYHHLSETDCHCRHLKLIDAMSEVISKKLLPLSIVCKTFGKQCNNSFILLYNILILRQTEREYLFSLLYRFKVFLSISLPSYGEIYFTNNCWVFRHTGKICIFHCMLLKTVELEFTCRYFIFGQSFHLLELMVGFN